MMNSGLPFLIAVAATVFLPALEAGNDYFCGSKPADIVFLLDSSSSIWGPDFKKQTTFVSNVTKMFQIDPTATQVGVASFGNHFNLEFSLNQHQDKRSLVEAIGNIRHRGGFATNTAAAIRYMRSRMFSKKQGARSHVVRVGIVMTDGRSKNILRTIYQASRARNRNHINLFAIGIGDSVNKVELRGIAGSSKYSFTVDSFTALDSIGKLLAVKTCQATDPPTRRTFRTRAPTTTTTTSTTTTTTTTTTTMPTTTTATTTTTTTPIPTTSSMMDRVKSVCNGKAVDVVFAIDATDSVSEKEFRHQLNLASQITNLLDIGQNSSRVGLLTFADHVRRIFDLNANMTRKEIQKALLSVRTQKGGGNVNIALRSIRMKSFRRSVVRLHMNAAQVGVVITGSRSADAEQTKKEADLASKAGLTMFAVGVGSKVSSTELHDITAGRKVGHYFFHVNEYQELDTVVYALATQICYAEPASVAIADAGCGARQPADILIALDSSIAAAYTKKTLNFFKSIVHDFDVDPNKIQVGLLPGDCKSSTGFVLDEYQDKNSVMAGFDNVEVSDMSRVIHRLRNMGFRRRSGTRAMAKKVGILVVDGSSQDLMKALEEAEKARSMDIELYVVAVGDGFSEEQLEMICSSPATEHLYHVRNYQELDEIRSRLYNHICDEL